jgi:EmrB/QacA subfamily drug resistance transporter
MSQTSTTSARREDEPYADPDDHGHRHLGLALALICTAQLMVVLDATIVNIALPNIGKDLGFSLTGLQWVVNAYALAFGGLLLLGGRAGDLLGRRKVFVAGLLVFSIGSLLGGIATSEAFLLGARVLQGVGAAIASPTALSLITTTFPEGPRRNKAMGVYSAMSASGAAVGLLLGGVLTDLLNWRWVFFVNVPIGIAVALLAPRVLGESARQRGGFDLPGAITSTAGLSLLVYGLTHAATAGWGEPVTVVTLVLAAALLAAFVVIEMRSAHPLMPLRIFRDRNRAGSYAVVLAIGSAMFAVFFFLSLFVQQILHYSPLKAGVAFLPFTVGILFGAAVSSRLAARLDARYLMTAGLVLAAIGLFWLSFIEETSSYWHLLLPMLVTSVGMGTTFVPLTLTALSNVPNRDAGLASGVLNTMQQVGGSLGLATLTTVAATVTRNEVATLARHAGAAPPAGAGAKVPQSLVDHALTAGYTTAFLVAVVVVAVGAVIAFVTIRVKHEELDAVHPGVAV